MYMPVIWARNNYRIGHSFMLAMMESTHAVLGTRSGFLEILKFCSDLWFIQCANNSLLITVCVNKDPCWLWRYLILTPDISLFVENVRQSSHGISFNEFFYLCKFSPARNSDELNGVLISSFEFCDRRCFGSALTSIGGPKPHSCRNTVELRNRNEWTINCLYFILYCGLCSACLNTCVVSHGVATTER